MATVLAIPYTPNKMSEAWYGQYMNRKNQLREAWDIYDQPALVTKDSPCN